MFATIYLTYQKLFLVHDLQLPMDQSGAASVSIHQTRLKEVEIHENSYQNNLIFLEG